MERVCHARSGIPARDQLPDIGPGISFEGLGRGDDCIQGATRPSPQMPICCRQLSPIPADDRSTCPSAQVLGRRFFIARLLPRRRVSTDRATDAMMRCHVTTRVECHDYASSLGSDMPP